MCNHWRNVERWTWSIYWGIFQYVELHWHGEQGIAACSRLEGKYSSAWEVTSGIEPSPCHLRFYHTWWQRVSPSSIICRWEHCKTITCCCNSFTPDADSSTQVEETFYPNSTDDQPIQANSTGSWAYRLANLVFDISICWYHFLTFFILVQ